MSKRMGVLGPKGTHSEAAASYLNGRLETPYELVTVPDLFECLQDDSVPYGVIHLCKSFPAESAQQESLEAF